MKTSTALEMYLLNGHVSPAIVGSVAYKMLQRARKAGAIRSSGWLWEIVQKE
jgi:hypothetical protein